MFHRNRTSVKLIAAVLGILAVGVPAVLFNVWLKGQGEAEVSATAAWALGSAEMQLGKTVQALDGLAARGVDSCRPAHLEAMRQAAVLTGPIKETMLIAPGGQVMCTDTGVLLGRPQVVSSTMADGIVLDVLRHQDRPERFLRVRKIGKPDRPSIAALVPASLLLPQASMQGGRLLGQASMVMDDGTPVAEAGAAPDAADAQGAKGAKGAQFTHRIRSSPYRLTVTLSMPRNSIIANYDDLRRVGMMISGVIAMVILSFALIYPWHRDADNPVDEIAKAIAGDEFVPYYQPVVDIQTGKLLGAEALVRWRRRDGSYLEPGAFIPLMESNGLILELMRTLMRRVRGELGEALKRRPELTIAFNIAPQHFDDALILNDVGTIFGGSPIKLSQVVLELTERHQVADLAGMRRTIAALQRLGCKVAIDDVGTGHNGLSYILKLGVDIIKIDKIFVDAIGVEGHSKAIIETLIDLANNMRMDIVAEGVQTFDQVSFLRERGIKAAQGYVFAPPLPANSFLQLLDAMDPPAEQPAPAPAKRPAGASGAREQASGRPKPAPVRIQAVVAAKVRAASQASAAR